MLYRILLCLSLLGSQLAFAQSINPKNVTILRDSYGVPHIFGKTDADAAYGLAYAHSEDDFDNMQRAVLAGKGMLGRVDGKDGVLFDFGLQMLNLDSLVDARYELDLSAEYRAVLEGYAQGINDYAAAHPKEVFLKKSFPIEAKDLVKSSTLSVSLMAGLGMALKAVNENRIQEFLGANETHTGSGSNALAVAPEKMADGKPYLLVNSHQPIEGRFAWYEAHIVSEEGWNCVGGLFPGGNMVFVGSNEHLGWAHTFNYHQFGDIYELELNPKNKNQYKYDGEWRNFYVRKAKLKVKIAGMVLGVTKKVKSCAYGPVYKSKYGTYAFRFAAYEDIRATEQWFKMNKAKNFGEFTEAMKMQAVPLFNTVYADDKGNIMLHSGGKVPKRNPKLDWSAPITANTSDYNWTGILDYEQLPHVENPECGFVYNANNTPLHCTGDSCNWDEYFPGLQSFEYNRGERFGRLMKEHVGKFTEADLERIKFDNAYDPAGAYVKKFEKLYSLDENKYPDIADAIQKLNQWDKKGNVDSRDAALALVTHDFLAKEVDAPFAILMIRDEGVSEEMAVDAVRKAKKLMLKTHGTLDVALGDVQRLMRGDKSYPIDGLREVPRACDTKLVDKKKGLFKMTAGDGYIQILRFDENGANIRSVNAFGASNRPESKHYTDQMELFKDHQYKPMSLERNELEKTAERVYHPGEF
ncbi:MAG: penicillin acylase family protein [Flavobacteriales bacterium]|nr:penicillin acylase family protein [Flavobacteriales bacterium]